MNRKTALIGFLVLQAIVIILWVLAVLPLMREGGPAFIGTAQETFTGRIFSSLAFNFRSGETTVISPRFDPNGPLLWTSLLMLAAGACAATSAAMFRRDRTWLSVALACLGLALGLGGAWFLVEQWSGDTTFPAGSVGPLWLYAMARVFLLQLFIGWALLALATVAVIAGFATPQRPLGFHVVALNWLVVAATWLVSYLALYVAPPMFAGAGA
jgi:heme/copper-type cytochrome/quinol oxidase subunit 3